MNMGTSTNDFYGKSVLTALILLQAMAASNCGGGAATVLPPVTCVSISPQNVTLLTGAVQQFTATVNCRTVLCVSGRERV